MSTGTAPLRIGCLGAARIAPAALIRPATKTDAAEVVAVAARDRARAQQFADKHKIPRVLGSYQELVESPDIDAVYIPLPNGLHGAWTMAALAAGKHVLCEKPFTSNAEEAVQVAQAAARTDRVVMEAFHWRYHPLAARMLEIIGDGTLGEIERVEASMIFPLYRRNDIRWQLDLAGGSLMDAGCYPVHMVRTLAGAEPSVESAKCRVRSPGVDRWIQAELRFPDGRSGRVTSGMWSASFLRLNVTVTGSRARMKVFNPTAQVFNLIRVKGGGRNSRERIRGRTTYDYQLEAFTAAVRGEDTNLTPPSDSVANMTVIDAIYRSAGLQPRPVSTAS